MENCLKTRYEEKIRLYCKILAGSVSLDNINERSSAEDYDLTPGDLRVALEIYRQQEDMPAQFDGENTELKFVVN